MRDLYMIACVSKDGGLGNHGELLWHIPEDIKFFRETTQGGAVIMGRKTFESIGKALPGRENVVLSRRQGDNKTVTWCDEGELKKFLDTYSGKKFIIGGASLYEKFLPAAEVIYLTEVDAEKPADVYFPQFDRGEFSHEVLQQGEHNGIKYQIIKYTRKETADERD